MIGAIIGDIVGSIYEWHNHRSKIFPLFGKGCFATDDSIMTLAVAKALLECNGDYTDLSNKAISAMQEVGRPYPRCGFGGSFYHWIYTDNPKPYGSYGNGAAMRVSAVGFVAKDIEEAKKLSRAVTEISHNHPEGIKGAESVAVAIVLAKQGWTKEDIKSYVCDKYYKIGFTLDEIRETYQFNETCQNTVPQAFEAFFESASFEDAIRNAISVGGDSDTLAAITGGIAEAYYGVPQMIRMKAWKYLDKRLKTILNAFEDEFGREEPKFRKERIPYQEWMFDIYKDDLNPEHWCDEFPSLMWGLGFEMDCYESFNELYPNAVENERDPQKQEDRILEKLSGSDLQIVGNYIFSRFRELTHWCDYGYEPMRAEYFFPKAFEILERKINEIEKRNYQKQGNSLVDLPTKCYNNEYKCKEVHDDIRRKGKDSKRATVHESGSVCQNTGSVVCNGKSMGEGTLSTKLPSEETISRLLRTEFNQSRGQKGRMKTNKSKGNEIEETTSQKLYNYLYEACNILRGPINQDEFKDYITPLLFFKRLSDVYDEETARALEKSGGDIEYANMDCNHRFIIPEGCHWNNVREKVTDIGQSIVNSMTSIERANPETLQGVFSSFDEASWTNKGKLDDARLRDLVEHMSRIVVGNKNYSADVMGDSYEYLLKKFADESNSNAGEFYTPRAAVKLLVKILAPQPGETVYDPACGTGGMLIEAIRYMNDDKSSYGKIYGQEKNLSTSAIARMNLFLHGAEDFKILQGDTLRSPLFMEYGEIKRFDCVIANPPFSLENWGSSMFASDVYGRNIYGCPTDSNGDYAWIQHMVKSMNSVTGRCAVVLPQGVLFRSQEKKMRIKMLEDDKLECVITLAKNIFYNTQLAPCILVFRDRKSEQRKKKVLLVDASNIYTAKRAQNILSDEPGGDVDKIFGFYQAYDDAGEVAKVVTNEEIEGKDYTLAVNRYIEKEQAPAPNPAEVRARFEKTMAEVFEAEAELKRKLVEGGFLDE